MSATLKQIRKFEGEYVCMRFEDGREEYGRLLCATKDMDGTEHLIYERTQLDDAAPSSSHAAPSPCVYADARTLVSIEPLPLSKVA
ncbi:MAG: hypothetical protein NVS9B15_11960 [Acidobacteriaceae bacterium]